MTGVDDEHVGVPFIPGEIVRLRLPDPSYAFMFGPSKPRYAFVRFLGVFDGQAVVRDANDERAVVGLKSLSPITCWWVES